ncbi:MAG: arginine--tRNA ligase [Nanoarchaeota archaeon]
MSYRQQLRELLARETKLPALDVDKLLALPPDPTLGDYAFPCFLLGKNPKQEAEKLAEKLKARLKLPLFLAKMEIAGPYLNFFLNPVVVAEQTLSRIRQEKEKFGSMNDTGKEPQKPHNIVIEFCGPNTNKPLHLGHLRNIAIGNALCRLLAFQGNKVHPVNIVNDRGIHICQSMLAYQKWGKGKKPDNANKKGDHFVGDYYVLFANRLKEDPGLKREAQELLFHWEDKDPKVQKLWKTMTAWVLQGFVQTYKRVGITFEKEYFESDYYEQGKEIVFEGLKKGIFEKDDQKNIVAKLEAYNLPNKVVLRGDGTSIYITQDLYLAQLRYQDFRFDTMVYVVASEQNLHFKQLFKILELLERPYARRLHHLSYGLVNLPTGRMKSREGTVVDADDILNELASLARQEVRVRYEKLAEKEIERRAESIALAAIKFFMLKMDAGKEMVFDPKESISFEGETGPYVQYTHARGCSILEKAGKSEKAGKRRAREEDEEEDQIKQGRINYALLADPREKNLVTLLSRFPETAEEAANYKLHVLCRYLLDLAQAFNEFYHACPVISEDKELMKARLELVRGVRQVLANGLQLLGIEAMEEM